MGRWLSWLPCRFRNCIFPTGPRTLLNSSLLYFCIVYLLHRFGVHLIGKYLPIVKHLDDPVSIVFSSPTSCNVRIEKIKPAIRFFHVILVMVMTMKYCLQILLLLEKFDYLRTGNTAVSPSEWCDVHKNEQLPF